MALITGSIQQKRDLELSFFDLDRLRRSLKPLVYMTDDELIATPAGSMFTFDIECYRNWFFIAFRCITTKKVVTFEITPENPYFNATKLGWMLARFCVISYNGIKYDQYVMCGALQGMNNHQLKAMSDDIIVNELWGSDIVEKYSLNLPQLNHIDVIEVCPLQASLKAYAARLHADVIQDLPFEPDELLDPEMIEIGRLYCGNDLAKTEMIFQELAEQIKLRIDMSNQYQQDLRSKSDAQIAEAVICKELEAQTGQWPKRPSLSGDYTFMYKPQAYLQFQTPLLAGFYRNVCQAVFGLNDAGRPALPIELDVLLPIGVSVYQFGMGGLHSTELARGWICGEDEELADIDVESYYPKIILNQGLYPQHLGEYFLNVYGEIVSSRVTAKRSGNKVIADSLKIVINGSFGKFGSKYSALYSPDLLGQVTLTGQLSLLLLIERFELAGLSVISANTDGIVVKCKKHQVQLRNQIVKQWETDCNFVTEETQYMGLFSRGINDYIAVKRKQDPETKEWLYQMDGCKLKGEYGNPWDDKKMQIFRFHKNPEMTIVSIAVQKFITQGIPLGDTIRSCKDITKFVCVKNVKGGGVYLGSPHANVRDGELIGKVVRWYYARGVTSSIHFKGSGNKVATSDGAVPIMDFGVGFPDDIDYDKYINEAKAALLNIGYLRKPRTLELF